MTAALRFAAYAASLVDTTLPPEIIHHAKRAIVDWYAALLPGAITAPATLLERALAEDLDHGEARLALGRSATVRTAALINGTAAHTVEVDDIYRQAIFHPGAPTIAAAMALAQARQMSGLQLITAVVAGYEISTRIGAALGRTHYHYWHNTGTAGTFGAACAAATLLGLDTQAHAHALCTGATFAAGLQQAFRMDSMSKPLHAGHAAQAGVLAALSAEQGVTGSLDVLDGEVGMGRAMAQEVDWEQATASLGSVFNIAHITFKNHACCGHTFAAIDGALALRARMGLHWQDLDEIEIQTYGPALDVAGNAEPRTAAQARFSLPFVVASALIYGSVRLSAFTPARLTDPDIRALMARIRLSIDPVLNAQFPAQRAARLVFRCRDGRQENYLQPTRKGDPDLPLSDEELSAKFMELAVEPIGGATAQGLLAQLWELERLDNVRRLALAS